MKTYNGIFVPNSISPKLIVSAFVNDINQRKVDEYYEIMMLCDIDRPFPPIKGFPFIVTEEDYETHLLDIDEGEISERHLGKIAWKVTDGHHRTLAAIAANLFYLEVELDYACLTDKKDILNFKNTN